MYLHLARHELLTVLAALQQARTYRKNSRRYIRMSAVDGKITEEFALERIAHADMIVKRYTDLATKVKEMLDAGGPTKVNKARVERRVEAKAAIKPAKTPDSPARNALQQQLAARRARLKGKS